MAAGLPHRLSDDWAGLGSWEHTLHMISLALQEKGVPCQTTCEVPSKGVVITHPQAVGFDFRFPDKVCFICYQGDWPRCLWADAHIVINRYQLSGPNLTLADRLFGAGPLLHLPFIPEPSLIPREVERGDRFENLAYFGTPYNLLPELRAPAWKERLASMGLNFIVEEDVAKHADYSAIDCVIAVRPRDRNPDQKPPSKLWNAWRAGAPAILGPEAGFREQRKSDLDYLEAETPEQVLAAITRLQTSPGLYRQMISWGLQRSREVTPDHLIRMWIEALQGPIADLFKQKQNRNLSSRLHTARTALRATLRRLRHLKR